MMCESRNVRVGLSAALALSSLVGSAGMALAATGNGVAESQYVRDGSGTAGGDTKCYALARGTGLATPRGSSVESIRVRIPVAIHYVADSEGRLVGPSDDVVEIENRTNTASVHVNGIAVESSGAARIVRAGDVGSSDDMVSFRMTPEGGDEIDLWDYLYDPSESEAVTFTEPFKGKQWDIGARSSDDNDLHLNGLVGEIGGFGELDASVDEQVGVIHWRIGCGTRAEADERARRVEVHYNPGRGSYRDGQPVPDGICRVYFEDAVTGQPVMDSDSLSVSLDDGSGVVGPSPRTNYDGSVTRWTFDGWYTGPEGDDAAIEVSRFLDLGLPEDLAGHVVEVWAHFEPHTYMVDGSGVEVEVDAIP